MKFLIDFFPLLLFFAAFKLADIYVATTVAIVASFAQTGWHRWRHGRFEPMHLVTLVIVTVFGGLTLLLHDDTFIRWKPTIVYWVLGVIVLGSHFVGNKTAIERMLDTHIQLPANRWAQFNLSWGLFFLVLGGLNLYVAFYYGPENDAATRQEIWVNFKVFGLLGLTLLFAVAQAAVLARHMQPPAGDDSKGS